MSYQSENLRRCGRCGHTEGEHILTTDCGKGCMAEGRPGWFCFCERFEVSDDKCGDAGEGQAKVDDAVPKDIVR